MANPAFFKFCNHWTRKDIGVFCKKLFERLALFGQVTKRYIGYKDTFKNLGTADATIFFGFLACLLDDFQNVIARLSRETIVQFRITINQSNFVGCFAFGIRGKYIADLGQRNLQFSNF